MEDKEKNLETAETADVVEEKAEAAAPVEEKAETADVVEEKVETADVVEEKTEAAAPVEEKVDTVVENKKKKSPLLLIIVILLLLVVGVCGGLYATGVINFSKDKEKVDKSSDKNDKNNKDEKNDKDEDGDKSDDDATENDDNVVIDYEKEISDYANRNASKLILDNPVKLIDDDRILIYRYKFNAENTHHLSSTLIAYDKKKKRIVNEGMCEDYLYSLYDIRKDGNDLYAFCGGGNGPVGGNYIFDISTQKVIYESELNTEYNQNDIYGNMGIFFTHNVRYFCISSTVWSLKLSKLDYYSKNNFVSDDKKTIYSCKDNVCNIFDIDGNLIKSNIKFSNGNLVEYSPSGYFVTVSEKKLIIYDENSKALLTLDGDYTKYKVHACHDSLSIFMNDAYGNGSLNYTYDANTKSFKKMDISTYEYGA